MLQYIYFVLFDGTVSVFSFFLNIIYLLIFILCAWCFTCIYVYVRVSSTLELELQRVASCHVVARN